MYKLKSVLSAEDIEAEDGQSWFRYIIVSDYNNITGVRAGTKSEVRTHVQFLVSLLNAKYKEGKTKTYKPVQINSPQY